MVFVQNQTTAQIESLPTAGGRLLYDTDRSRLVFRDGTATSDLIFTSSANVAGINTSNPDVALEINATTGNNLRLTYNDSDGTAAFYADFNMSASGDLTINASGNDILTGADDNFDVAAHDGNTKGLHLGGVLLTTTAAQLNYNDITTAGTAEASKALVLDGSSDITGINALTATTINADTLNVSGDIEFISDSAVGNTALCPLTITRTSSVAPADGLGVCIDFNIENSVNVNTSFGKLAVVADDITDATEDGKYDFKLISGGTEDVSVATLNSSGEFACTNLVETSDRRVKENIVEADLEESYNKVMNVKMVDYNFIYDSKKTTHRGVIAQEIQQIIPNAVENVGERNGIDDFLCISNRELLAHLMASVQHLNKIVKQQSEKIEQQEHEINNLR